MSEEPERVDLETPDIAAERRAALEKLFPGVIADGVLDATRLGELLDTEVSVPADSRERFGLMWAGKQDAIGSLLTPSRGTLIPELDESVDFDGADHVFIEGDNLEVLKLLQKAYNDRVKLIYIDPPYNTGHDFVYPDDYSDTLSAYLRFTGQLDPEGNRTSASADVLGRRHSRWLSMMYPRLVLARNLLTQDGVIAISIDDHEVQNLRSILDEIFGQEGFIASVIWQKRYSRENRGAIGDAHEYLLIYAREPRLFQETRGLIPPTEKQMEVYKNPNKDPRGRWRAVPMTAQGFRPNQMYEVITPSGACHRPPEGRCWSMTEPNYLKLRGEGRIYFGKNDDSQPSVIRYMDEVEGFVPWTWWPSDEVGHTDEARKEIRRLFGTQTVFDTAKPLRLLQRLLHIAVPGDGIVLDFFAGSGSTADAVLRQNALDSRKRRFIAVQLPEPTGFEEFEFISDITRARIAAVSEEVGGVGLRSYRLDASNFRGEKSESPTELFDLSETTLEDPDRADEDIAAEVLLKEGIPLHTTWERRDAGGAAVIEAGGVAVVLSLEVTDEVVSDALGLGARVVVFLEDGFAGADAVKANAVTNAKNSGITLKTV